MNDETPHPVTVVCVPRYFGPHAGIRCLHCNEPVDPDPRVAATAARPRPDTEAIASALGDSPGLTVDDVVGALIRDSRHGRLLRDATVVRLTGRDTIPARRLLGGLIPMSIRRDPSADVLRGVLREEQ